MEQNASFYMNKLRDSYPTQPFDYTLVDKMVTGRHTTPPYGGVSEWRPTHLLKPGVDFNRNAIDERVAGEQRVEPTTKGITAKQAWRLKGIETVM